MNQFQFILLFLFQVNLLIIDECHHATGKHPMREVMRYYASVKQSNPEATLPRILGLTASVIQKKCKSREVPKMLKELEICLDSHLVTSSNYDEVLEYTTKPKEVFVPYDNTLTVRNEHFKMIIDVLCHHLDNLVLEKNDSEKVKRGKKNVQRVLRNIMICIEELGEWCGSSAIEFERSHFQELLKDESFSEMADILHKLSNSLQSLADICKLAEERVTDIEQHLSHHAKTLLEILRIAVRDGDQYGLIFVKERCTARILSKLLNHLAKSGKDPQLLSKSLVGSSNSTKFGDFW